MLRQNAAALARLKSLSPDDCGLSSVTAFELFAGAEKSRSPAQESARLRTLFEIVDVLNFDETAAARAAVIRAKLETAGTPIGPYDLLIAGHAIALGVTLATGNTEEFKRVSGLRIEKWT